MLRLTLYQRPGCHLCEAMWHELQALQQDHAFELEIVDIEDAPALEAAYGRLIPVLKHGDTEICHYFLELGKLQQYFSEA